MALRPIRYYPDPVLRKKAKEVSRIDPLLRQLVEDMAETMYAAPGVGLAAPQIGVSKRVLVVDVGEGLIPMINPKIQKAEGEVLGLEGCLSFPNLYGEVERAAGVGVKFQTLEGRWERMEATGLMARAIQHEIDHLDGVVFIDKAVNLRYIVPEELRHAEQTEQFVG